MMYATTDAPAIIVLIESYWNLRGFTYPQIAEKLSINRIILEFKGHRRLSNSEKRQVLIESYWNLSGCQLLCNLSGSRINRIILEFKAYIWHQRMQRFSSINRIILEFKDSCYFFSFPTVLSINRIILELKEHSGGTVWQQAIVLIESYWNLKYYPPYIIRPF